MPAPVSRATDCLPVTVALVDFGNTLADEGWMRRNSERFPGWTAAYLAEVEELRRDWDVGIVSSGELAARIGLRIGCTPEDAHTYMRLLCHGLDFYPRINAALRRRRARGGRQALVTVNPDLFGEVADHYGLPDSFDAIITSWACRTDDKVALCWHALESMGLDDPRESVLVDNVESNVAGWVAVGGQGYHFSSDEAFVTDVTSGRVPGFGAEDLGTTGRSDATTTPGAEPGRG